MRRPGSRPKIMAVKMALRAVQARAWVSLRNEVRSGRAIEPWPASQLKRKRKPSRRGSRRRRELGFPGEAAERYVHDWRRVRRARRTPWREQRREPKEGWRDLHRRSEGLPLRQARAR